MRKLKVYSIYAGRVDSIKNIKASPLSIVLTYKQAKEYVLSKIILDHMSHYIQWCDLNGRKNKNSTQNKLDYALEVLDLEEEKKKYSILKIKYTRNALAVVLRIFSQCIPIGCSFDTVLEVNMLRQALDKVKEKEQSNNSFIDSSKH